MLNTKKPLGFGTEKQIAEFFGLPISEVRELARRGLWPHYTIGGRRVFDADELLRMLAEREAVSA